MNIINVLDNQFTGYASEILINNLPSMDGLLPVQRKVLWALHNNKVNSNKPFIKLLRASAMSMVYYTFGDMPLTQAMKNMANNGLNYYYLLPKGSFGDKRKKEDKGASPRYIECKLSEYSESMLKDINKNIVPMKRNFDNTEDEPIILPSVIPNILVNISQSIAVGEASKIPSHNLNETCDSIIDYLKNDNIDKAIEILKCPDFIGTCGKIIYNKEKIKTIYKTGKGSITLIGKYIYDKKENKISIIEVPYEVYIEDIEDKLINAYDKGLFKEITHIHNNSGRQGIQLDVYLKKGTNINQFEKKLRKYTPFESKFSCNFTVLDLDGKTPLLMSLEDIYNRWILHRINCIKNELQFDIDKNTEELNKLKGLEIINQDLDKAIKLIRGSRSENEAIQTLINHFNLNDKQAEYISTIKLVNINQEWIFKKIQNINELIQNINQLKELINSEAKIKNIIIDELYNVKKKYGIERKTEIVYENEIDDISKIDIVPQFNCSIIYTKDGYIKKILRTTDIHKLKDNDIILEELSSTNKSILYLFTNKANRYKLPCYELETCNNPSKALGEYIPNIIDLEQDEGVIKIVSIEDETKLKGCIISVYENGKIAKVDMGSFMSTTKKLVNCYSAESKLIGLSYIEKDIDVFMVSSEGRGLIVNTSYINSKKTRITQGNIAMKLNDKFEDNKVIGCIIDPKKDKKVIIKTEKGNRKEFFLDDVAPTDKPNEERGYYEYMTGRNKDKGNFIYNCRHKKDRIVELM